MIDKIANNEYNTEELNLHTTEAIREKLDYYRSLLGRTHDLSDADFEGLKADVAMFFNLKSVYFTDTPPARLVRISNNNRILAAQGKPLSYLTDISQLLAPPAQICGYGRCNIPGKQVLYCATTEALAYWETKPRNGDVITLSHYELKPDAKVNCTVIGKDKFANPVVTNQLKEVYYLLDDFFVDVFSYEVDRTRPKDYVFSALLSSEHLFYPIAGKRDIEGIIYPSVQKKKFGENFAIRNDLILDRYNLIGVETRFILDEYENIDPATEELTTDSLIGSFGTTAFDFETGKILYDDRADMLFPFFRSMQMNGGKQTRQSNSEGIKSVAFDLSPKPAMANAAPPAKPQKFGRNDRVSVVYPDGSRKDDVKYKFVQQELINGKCRLINGSLYAK